MRFDEFLIVKEIVSAINENIDETDAEKIANYISRKVPQANGRELGNLFGDVSKRLVPNINSHFLSDIFNSLSEKAGKRNRFQSSRDPGNHNWANPNAKSKSNEILQKTKEQARYERDPEVVRKWLINSIKFDPKITAPGVIRNAIDNAIRQVFGNTSTAQMKNAASSVNPGFEKIR